MRRRDWVLNLDRHDHQRIPGWLWAGLGFALWTLAFGLLGLVLR